MGKAKVGVRVIVGEGVRVGVSVMVGVLVSVDVEVNVGVSVKVEVNVIVHVVAVAEAETDVIVDTSSAEGLQAEINTITPVRIRIEKIFTRYSFPRQDYIQGKLITTGSAPYRFNTILRRSNEFLKESSEILSQSMKVISPFQNNQRRQL